MPQIGRAKSRGFETISATETDDINATTSIYRHYLFDIEMFTHLNAINISKLYNRRSCIRCYFRCYIVQSVTATKNTAVTSITTVTDIECFFLVVTLNDHGLETVNK